MQNVLDTGEPDQRAEVFHEDNAWAAREEEATGENDYGEMDYGVVRHTPCV